MRVKDIANFFETFAPTSLQEPYDNIGLLIGDYTAEIKKTLITLDVTEAVIDEAIQQECNLIIAHHPLIFKGIKHINPNHWIGRCVIKLIENNINVYVAHTNLDNVHTGVNKQIADKLGLKNCKILQPKQETLSKITFYVPIEQKDDVLSAMFAAGAGKIGNYDDCSFQTEGYGTFRPNDRANPIIGNKNELERVKELSIDVLVQNHHIEKVLKAMKDTHPYEEVAYYLVSLKNKNQESGLGMVGELSESMNPTAFFKFLKCNMELPIIKHTRILDEKIKKIALCGGSGSFLLPQAIHTGASVFITADIKYHDFFEANSQITLIDIGHYESEIFTKNLIFDVLKYRFPTFVFLISNVNTNPINYF